MDLATLDQAIDMMRRKGVRVLVAGDVRIELGPEPADVTVSAPNTAQPDFDAESRAAARIRERHEAILFRSAP